MKEVWRELLFSDEDQRAKLARDPVAPALRSPKALKKVHRKGGGPGEPRFTMTTTPSAKQKQALELLDTIVV